MIIFIALFPPWVSVPPRGDAPFVVLVMFWMHCSLYSSRSIYFPCHIPACIIYTILPWWIAPSAACILPVLPTTFRCLTSPGRVSVLPVYLVYLVCLSRLLHSRGSRSCLCLPLYPTCFPVSPGLIICLFCSPAKSLLLWRKINGRNLTSFLTFLARCGAQTKQSGWLWFWFPTRDAWRWDAQFQLNRGSNTDSPVTREAARLATLLS